MSRFYMTASNSRGNTTSAAGRASGQDVHLRGWNVGVQVNAEPDPGDGEDVFYIYATAGSKGAGRSVLIGTVQLIDGEPTFTPANDRMPATV